MIKLLPLIRSAIGKFGWEVRRIPDLIDGDWLSAASRGYPEKASGTDQRGRFREIISDPLNLLIERDSMAGVVFGGMVRLHTGLLVPVTGSDSYYGGFGEILIYNRGVHEPLEEFVFQELLRVIGDAPTMLELGAYWGHYSMWMKTARPNAEVYLVEPDASNLKTGVDNFKRNKLQGHFINKLVRKDQFQVDQFMQEKNLARLDVLHADIQGYEVEMLQGCSRSFDQGKISYCFISTHSQDLHNQVLQLLESASFRIEASADFDNESTSFDGLVFAVRKDLPSVLRSFQYLGRTKRSAASPKEVLDVLTSYCASAKRP